MFPEYSFCGAAKLIKLNDKIYFFNDVVAKDFY
jgi:hypothetical protein